MTLPYFISFTVLGKNNESTTRCRTKKNVQHAIKIIENYTLTSFKTNAIGIDISKLEILN